MNIRKGTIKDLEGILALRDELKLSETNNSGRKGFLMGSSAEEYLNFIEHDLVKILEDEEHILQGYTIILLKNTFKGSSVWAKIKPIINGLNRDEINISSLCFVEQLAISQNSELRYYAKNLALVSIVDALMPLSYCITTVVEHPIKNWAALRFLKFCGFRRVGSVTEDYPDIKNVISGVFLLDKQDLIATLLGRWNSEILKIIDPITLRDFVGLSEKLCKLP